MSKLIAPFRSSRTAALISKHNRLSTERHARAVITAGDTTVSLDVTFGADNLMLSVFTSARLRDDDGPRDSDGMAGTLCDGTD